MDDFASFVRDNAALDHAWLNGNLDEYLEQLRERELQRSRELFGRIGSDPAEDVAGEIPAELDAHSTGS